MNHHEQGAFGCFALSSNAPDTRRGMQRLSASIKVLETWHFNGITP